MIDAVKYRGPFCSAPNPPYIKYVHEAGWCLTQYRDGHEIVDFFPTQLAASVALILSVHKAVEADNG
jgi:hypothetical protein